jgi:type I restriction enzyme, S subunit
MTDISTFFNFSTIRLSFIADVIDPQPDHRAPALAEKEGYPYVGIRDVNPDGSINIETARKVELEAVKKQEQSFKLIPGDIVFCKVGTLGLPKRIQPVPQMALSATLVLIKPKPTVDSQFLYYALDSNPVINQCQLEATGSTRQALGIQQIRRFDIPFVSLDKQRAIAHFLDRKTAAIDTLIAKKQRLIQLLEEKRIALINQAVTKGLNPNVPMKDSGIPWIGEIPEHWQTLKLKYVSKLYRGKFTHRPRNDPKLYGGSYPFLQTGDIARADKFIENYNQTLNELGTQVSVCFPSHTIVMSIAANIGDIAITSFDAYFPDSVIGFTPKFSLSSDFLYYLLLSMKSAFDQESVENTQRNLNIDRVGNIDVPLPSIDEQEQIAKHLEASLTKQVNIKIILNNQIEKLQEYRQSLITAAVTGKINIGEEVAE